MEQSLFSMVLANNRTLQMYTAHEPGIRATAV